MSKPQYFTRRNFLKATTTATALSLAPTATAQKSPALWKTSNPGNITNLQIEDQILYVGTGTGTLRKIGAKNGAEIASTTLDNRIMVSGVALGDNHILVGTSNDRLHCLSKQDLSKQWERPLTEGFLGVTFTEGLGIVACKEELLALNPTDGTTKWDKQTDIFTRPVAIEDKIVIQGWFNSGDSVAFLSAVTGDIINLTQDYRYGMPYDHYNPATRENFDAHIAGNTVVVSPTLNVWRYEGYTKSGSQIWVRGGATRHAAAGSISGDASNAVAINVIDDGVVSFDRTSTDTNWQVPLDAKRGSVKQDGDTVYAAGSIDDTATILALNSESGVIKWEYTGDREWFNQMTTGRDRIFVATSAGEVMAFAKQGANHSLSSSQPTSAGDGAVPESTGDASFSLTTTNPTVPVGGEAPITLSAVNFLTSKSLTVQLLLDLPSGVQVTGVDDASQGSNQYTTTVTVDPSDESSITVNLQVNEPGEYNVVGNAIYYFEDDTENKAIYSQAVQIQTSEEKVKTSESEAGGGLGFTGPSAFISMTALGAVRYIKNRD
ncbi:MULTISPECIES: PQQ-binding-like beta-propeller repeat protein [Haloferax]|uniref:PQQ-binding-like beta-propeller repeat protein n=2 Tax=Haloferax TaxID=2251 RepID=A0A6G1Z7E4_9EURY|nr:MULTISPECIES: PQQ-binding-like beta-propeller repeat protein [Haloferax]KAB1184781.1 PQQ-binding-like beta-propeller repeat protein [Haloferax sp. CBA1149]MRW82413.1 PQQ-binding-like beta-propeller repeat protein [Haloferax marinisediminis]